MKRMLSLVLAMGMVTLWSGPAAADYYTPYVYIDCQPLHSLHVKTMLVYEYDDRPSGKHFFNLEGMSKDQRKQECQISDSVKATVYLRANIEHPRNDNVAVALNKIGVERYWFTNLDQDNDLLIKNGSSQIDVTSTVTDKKKKETKTEALHFGPKQLE